MNRLNLGGGVFESATVDTDILILKKEPYDGETVAVAANSGLNAKNIAEFVCKSAIECKFKEEESWIILSPIEQSIKNKIERFGTPLKDWDVKISRGLLTGLNDAFIINENTRNNILGNCKTQEERQQTAKLIRPILRGRDIRRNGYDWAGLYIILTHNGYANEAGNYINRIDINHFSALREWFDNGDWNTKPEKGSNQKRLAARTDKGDTPYNLRDCAYMDDFDEQKIIFSRISGDQPCFAMDFNRMLLNDTGYTILGDNLDYLLNELLSDIVWFAFKRYYMGGGVEKEFKVNNLLKLPIKKPGISYNLTDEEIKFISSSVN